MVGTDLARMVLVAAMAVPGMSLPLVAGLLVCVQMLNSPWGAARAALLPQVLIGERFVLGTAVFSMVTQTAQVVGFALGGLIVAWLGPSGALGVDAASFAVSAIVVRWGVRYRPAPGFLGTREKPGWATELRAGTALVLGDRELRALVALACVSGFYIAGEAVAAPYAAALGGGAASVGLLFASYAVGNVTGMALLTRVPQARRVRLLRPLAVLACAPLMGCAVNPGLGVTLALWFCSGAAGAYNLTASTLFVQAVPDSRRGQAFGLAVTALRVAQGLGVVLAGVTAEHLPPHQVVAIAGALGVLAATGAGLAWKRASLASGKFTRASDVIEPLEVNHSRGSITAD
jgi:predicted MFS family arabinose efflux permease